MSWRQIVTDAVVAGVRGALRTATQPTPSGQTPGTAQPAAPAPPDTRRRRTRTPQNMPDPTGGRTAGSGQGRGQTRPGNYPGDLRDGDVHITYAPVADGHPDPGEVVWAWVPYEEDPRQGKDRPVLVVAEQGGLLIALMLTSRDRSRGSSEDRDGRLWMDVGAGDWDQKRRPSEVRLDRVLRLHPDEVRREGGRLPKPRFDEVARELRELHGWS